MLYEVLGDIWVVQRNPYLEDDLLDNPKRRAAADRRAAPPPGRGGSAGATRPPTPSATRWSANCCALARAAVEALRGALPRRSGTCASRARACSGRVTAKDNLKFDGLSRVSHVTDATDWRVEYPVRRAHARQRGRDGRRWCKGCIELGLTIIPRGGGTGYTGSAVPLTWKSAVINTEKLEAMSEVEMGAPARRRPRRCRRSAPKPAW